MNAKYFYQLLYSNLLNAAFLRSNQRWLWIGLNKRSPDLQGSWQWSDRTPVSLTFSFENNMERVFVSVTSKLIIK